jgi:hypothetical protein
MDDDCAICLSPLVGEATAVKKHPSCRHTFHRTCYSAWAKPTCPVCRAGADRLVMVPNQTSMAWNYGDYIGLEFYDGNPVEIEARPRLIVVKEASQSVARVYDNAEPGVHAFVQLTYAHPLVLRHCEIL